MSRCILVWVDEVMALASTVEAAYRFCLCDNAANPKIKVIGFLSISYDHCDVPCFLVEDGSDQLLRYRERGLRAGG